MKQAFLAPSELDETIRGFARNMRTVALAAVVCSTLLAAPLLLSLDPRSPSLPLLIALRAVEIATWSYLAAVLTQFYRRTRLREYLLQYHTYWLSGVLAYPVGFLLAGGLLLIRSAIPPSVYELFLFVASGTWFVLVLVGTVLRRQRAILMQGEADANTALWQSLRRIDKKDIALLRFPWGA